MGDDRLYMMRALDLAAKGLGETAPNPAVGCVIVRDGEIVGEGWHARAGAPHAEAQALAAAGEKARGATAYVTLEPCAHHGRTPPCAEALIKAGVAEVVFAMEDPHSIAAGGAATLREAGIRTRSGVCADEARELNRYWIEALRLGRPVFIAKFAMSLDGRIATRTGDSKWITGPEARERAHDLRRRVDAIVVGAGTAIADDPALTARENGAVVSAPLRVLLDSSGRTPPSAAVFDRSGRGALVAAGREAAPSRLDDYRNLGAEALVLGPDAHGRPDVRELSDALWARGVRAVLVEGGGGVHGAFFDAGLIDEVWAFVAPVIIGGGRSAVDGAGPDRIADAWRLAGMTSEQLGRDLLIRGRIDHGGTR